ncbi:hypothetical protein WJX81_005695 [Elliptochloris bilobata]|uniref:EF-hand domain-containing protein n=1 Tax=Elliptochloris bilobata TaxID=381761 RepID=A0AAW1QIM2_9CHLO
MDAENEFEKAREARIAQNQAKLAQLQVASLAASLTLPDKQAAAAHEQRREAVRQELVVEKPRRTSTRAAAAETRQRLHRAAQANSEESSSDSAGETSLASAAGAKSDEYDPASDPEAAHASDEELEAAFHVVAAGRPHVTLHNVMQVFQRLREEDLSEERGMAMMEYARQVAFEAGRLDLAAFRRLCREALDVA